jgi:ABC-type glutathione transport system ATPase component
VSLRLEADRPEIFAIIGESGSGKTTLARMILNMVRRAPARIASGHAICRPSAPPCDGSPS